MLTDLRHTLRDFARRPGWTAAVVLTLACAIGANTTLFAYVASLVWPTIDAPEPDRLVRFSGSGSPESRHTRTSGPDFLDYKAENDVFSAFAATAPFMNSLTRTDGTTFRVTPVEVWGDFFELFGARPAAGRLLTPDDDPSSIVLTYHFWQRAFQGDPDVVGRSLATGGEHRVTVVGVAPKGFSAFVYSTSYYVRPERLADPNAGRDGARLQAIARLRDGVSLEQARTSLEEIGRVLDQRHPRETPRVVDLQPARSQLSSLDDNGRWATQSMALMVTVLVFLVLAAANVGNLLLARAVGRRRDVAVRRALGAGRWPLARRVLTESLLLALAGGAGGVAVGWAGSRVLGGYLALSPLGFTDFETPAELFDTRAAVFGAAAALVTAALFSLAPLTATWRQDVLHGLRDHGGGETRGSGALRHGSVVVQVALTVTLLVAAGLLGRTLLELRHVDPGFGTENLHVAGLFMAQSGEERAEAFRAVRERTAALPGVESAGLTHLVPLSGAFSNRVEATLENGDKIQTYRRIVGAHYHEALGVELLAGRFFNAHDTPDATKVALVNKAFADQVPGLLGRTFTLPSDGQGRDKPVQVVGIVDNTRLRGLHEAPRPAYFLPQTQHGRLPWTLMMIRTAPGAAPGPALAKVLREEFPAVALTDMAPFDEQMRRNVLSQRLSADLSLAVAGLGLLLAVVGLGSVLGYGVRCRRREIGLRMALGATAQRVVRMVLGEAGRMVALGLALGTAGAFGLGRLLRSQLYGLVDVTDTPTLVAVPVVLLGAAFMAAWLPASRAASVEPASALRDE